jgi:N-acetylglucosaminyldiphosphoundecaprenol N-acetyl-beta-D-mannosaminyltransferase
VRILGLEFFDGGVSTAVDRALDHRGLIVAPSGTCFRRLQRDEVYRHAMTTADLVLPDSGFMVLLWRVLRGGRIRRISGLAYLKELSGRAAFRQDRSVLWILPDENARDQTLPWLQSHGFLTTADDCYIAPIYGTRVEDLALLERVQTRQPGHVVIALSGGVQEKLGLYLREQSVPPADVRRPTSDPPADGFAVANLRDRSQRPAIHCIGAALGFIAGYQIAIPNWADRLYLGWLLRLLSNPRRFFPRAISALALPWLIVRYGEKLPAPTG